MKHKKPGRYDHMIKENMTNDDYRNLGMVIISDWIYRIKKKILFWKKL